MKTTKVGEKQIPIESALYFGGERWANKVDKNFVVTRLSKQPDNTFRISQGPYYDQGYPEFTLISKQDYLDKIKEFESDITALFISLLTRPEDR